ncbi:hypothetical protein BGI30_11045 [Snodgrassella alvi]|jgi:1-acyl-sn-glycerol-3-phosphate acyltransferase|uniref:lysophospholipid acyltransferase family protein n=1 Tax=Snodgrassella alvi TaxID=1196083 RepID=UPI000C1E325A|nr:lysophospholipid acyltransferase family protein [Snodgrassella alvi]PIT07344.1 hypothetical protein BGI30_11045 [Snodgrassella alvi]PIT28283.1 hypothetical protein BGI37_01515 [Snodgrassella alvi]PIT57125.1 hypothetical protein BHC59_06390 [Snodgrassella alvi]
MTKSQYTSLLTRCTRIIRLALWLRKTIRRVKRFNSLNATERNNELVSIAQNLLHILHVKVKPEQAMPDTASMPWLTVANHVTWLDIFVLMAYIPGGFIAKQSIKSWPVLGKLVTNGGTVYINRQSRQDINPVINAIEQALHEGKNVLFFPEAYTSEGLTTLPFKAALFQAAIDADRPVMPVAIRYYDMQGQRTPKVAFVGKTTLLRSLWNIVSLPEIMVKVDFAALLNADDNKITDRFKLKTQAEDFIQARVLSDSPITSINASADNISSQ